MNNIDFLKSLSEKVSPLKEAFLQFELAEQMVKNHMAEAKKEHHYHHWNQLENILEMIQIMRSTLRQYDKIIGFDNPVEKEGK